MMKTNTFKKGHMRGFTLIELLVVIAIIGILASVVLASLNTARQKGYDGKVKAQLSGVRAAAEILYDNSNNTYGTADAATVDCPATANSLPGDTAVASNITAITSIAGTQVKCATNAARTAYAIAGTLPSDTDGATGGQLMWCVDSLGNSQQITVTTIGNIALTDSTCAAMDAR